MRIAPNIPLRTKSPKPCNVCAGVCFALVIIGILLSTLIHNVIYQALSTGLSNKFVLSGPEAQDFAPWSEANNPSSPDIITDFYIVHVLNPNEVALNGAKPNVTEIGPLRYHFYRQRLNVTWDLGLDNDQLSFIPYNYYVIESDDAPYQANVLCENDPTSTCTVTTTASKIANSIYTTVNVPLIGILHSAGADLPGLLYDIIQSQNMTQPSALFIQKTAEEIIFGWEDPLLKALSGIAGNPTRYPGMQTNYSSADQARAIHSPTTLWTGVLTKHLARQYYIWDGMQELECCAYGPCGDKGTQGLTPAIKPWMTTDAETIRGAFGEQFHQFIDPTESLYVSTHDFGILRAWKLTNKGSGPAGSGTDIAGTGANGGSAGDTLEVKGITLLKFTYADGTMGNFSVNEEEAFAYNNYGPSGLLNQSLCEWGAKIFISQPRFYGGSQSLRDGVIGLGPATQDVGESFLGVEPFTGSTFQFSWRVQINALLEPTLLPGAPVPLFFPNVNPVFMPIAWASRYGEVNDNEASEFKSSVYLARDLMVSARWGGAGLACIALIAGIVFLMLGARRRRDQQHMREISAAAFYASNAGAGLDSSVYTPFLPPPGYSNGGGGDVGLSPISDVMLMQGPHGTTQQLGVAGGLNVGALPPGVNVNRSINSTGGVGVAGVQAFAGGGFFSPSHAANGPSNIAGGDVWEEEEVVAEGDLMAMHHATTSYEEAGNGGGGGAMSTASSFDASNTSPFPVVRQQPQQTRGGGYNRIPPNAVDMLPPDSPAQQGPKIGRSGNSGVARGSFDVDASGTQQRAQAANAARTWSATAGHY